MPSNDELTTQVEALTAKIAGLEGEVAALQTEMDRRDANEVRNCLNYGPCSRHDERMAGL